jgi:hypothetical protein
MMSVDRGQSESRRQRFKTALLTTRTERKLPMTKETFAPNLAEFTEIEKIASGKTARF